MLKLPMMKEILEDLQVSMDVRNMIKEENLGIF
jgi:hypothetical protein